MEKTYQIDMPYFTAGILAGGKSSRMGENKAFLRLGEETFLERTAGLFAEHPAFDEVLVSVADREGYDEVRYPLVMDERAGYGPLEGVYRLLLAAKNKWVFVAAIDMPFLRPELVDWLIGAKLEGAQIVIPETAKGIHPLFGLYSKQVTGAMESLFAQDIHKLRKLFEVVPAAVINIEESGLSETLLSNINTPEDYQRIRK